MEPGSEKRVLSRLGAALLYALVAGLFVGAMAPFGNYQHGSMLLRMAYWCGMMMVGGLTLELALTAADRYAPEPVPAWLSALVAIVAASIPIAALSRVVAVRLWPVLEPMLTPADWYLQSLVLGLPLGGAFWWLSRGRRRADPAQLSASARNAMLKDAICLQMEDHYVRVHTRSGSKLMLMRMTDAMERAARDGLQVHRSWWVALDAVEGAIVDGRNVRLRLVNGVEAPVARTAVARVRQAGLMSDA